MITARGLIKTLKGWMGKPIADPSTDPLALFASLSMALPNPDPILRRLGRAEDAHFAILTDPHVIGEVRSIRGNFRAYNWRLNPGNDEDPKSVAARDLCEEWMNTTPPGGVNDDGLQLDWQEVMWQMASAMLTGYRVHEPVWNLVNGYVLPEQVIDRPNRRVRFDAYGRPLLISTGNMLGAPIEHPSQMVISRHMPDSTNPYGIALLSACYWAHNFKHGGWQYFLKYCERNGLPWPFATYPLGAGEKEIDQLEKALAEMIEAGYIAAPEGTTLQLLSATNSGSTLPQERLIELCNREISKALTSQAMVAELHGVGSRAANETAAARQSATNESDRDISVASMGQIFKWITRFNFGDDVAPPWLEFFKESKAGKDRAETYQVAADMGARPSKKAMLDELGIPAAEEDEDALLPTRNGQPAATGIQSDKPQRLTFSGIRGLTFAKAAGGMTEAEALQLATEAADQAIEDRMIAPVAELLAQFEAQGKTLAEFHAALEEMVGRIDDEGLRDVIDRALQFSILRGAATEAD